MYNALILFLLLIKPSSILVVIEFNSDTGLTEQEFQDEKTMLINRIYELPKENSYRFLLFYWMPSLSYSVNLSSKESKTDIIHELSQKTHGKIPEGTEIWDSNTYSKLVHKLSYLYDSRSKIYSFGKGTAIFTEKTIHYDLKKGFLVEIVSVKNHSRVNIQNEMVDFSEKIIGRTACLDKVKAFNCDEGFILSMRKNCYASEKWYKPQCICDTKALKQYGITQDYPCPNPRFGWYFHDCHISSCGKRLIERNYRGLLHFRCYNNKTWENINGVECICDIFEIPGVHLDQCSGKSIGESCAYTCKEEDEFPKDAIIKCTIHGWDKEPVCEKSIGEKYKVVCESGFEKKGEEPTCQKTGEWTEHKELICSSIKKIFNYLLNSLLFTLL